MEDNSPGPSFRAPVNYRGKNKTQDYQEIIAHAKIMGLTSLHCQFISFAGKLFEEIKPIKAVNKKMSSR
jgi:hypothetical protein